MIIIDSNTITIIATITIGITQQQQAAAKMRDAAAVNALQDQHNAPGPRTTADEFLPPAEWPGLPSADAAGKYSEMYSMLRL